MIYVACSLNLQISIWSMLWIPLCSFRGLCWVRPLTLHHRLWSTSLSTSPPQSWTTPRPKQSVIIYHFHQLSSDIRSSVTLFLSTFFSHRRVVNCAAAQRHSLLIRRVTGEQAGKNRARQDWTGQSRTAFITTKKKQPPKPKTPNQTLSLALNQFLGSERCWAISQFQSDWSQALADAWEAIALLLLNWFLFWKIIRNFI